MGGVGRGEVRRGKKAFFYVGQKSFKDSLVSLPAQLWVLLQVRLNFPMPQFFSQENGAITAASEVTKGFIHVLSLLCVLFPAHSKQWQMFI